MKRLCCFPKTNVLNKEIGSNSLKKNEQTNKKTPTKPKEKPTKKSNTVMNLLPAFKAILRKQTILLKNNLVVSAVILLGD